MESLSNLAFFGSNANTEKFYLWEGDEEFIQDQIGEDGTAVVPNLSDWFMEMDSLSELVQDVNNKNVSDIKIDDTYSLEELLNVEEAFSPASSFEFDSPIDSPLSSSDESSLNLDELLTMTSPENVLSYNPELSVVEDSTAIVTDISEITSPVMVPEMSPVSVNSEASSSFDSDDFLQEFFSNSFSEENSPESNVEFIIVKDQSTVDFSSLESFPVAKEPESSIVVVKKQDQTQNVRYTPYGKKKEKTPEQKVRKKSQNRNAANKYRTKKKSEHDVILAEADALEKTNNELKSKVGGLKKEIDYLKTLMLDVIKARLSNSALKNGGNGDLSNALLNS